MEGEDEAGEEEGRESWGVRWMVSSCINLGWGRGTQMALCFKMTLINQLHNHNQNALVSLPPFSMDRS